MGIRAPLLVVRFPWSCSTLKWLRPAGHVCRILGNLIDTIILSWAGRKYGKVLSLASQNGAYFEQTCRLNGKLFSLLQITLVPFQFHPLLLENQGPHGDFAFKLNILLWDILHHLDFLCSIQLAFWSLAHHSLKRSTSKATSFIE